MSRGGARIALIGICLALIGVWGVWVPHRAAALVLSSWDLAEFVKFLPGTSVTRELFYLPVWCAGVVLALIAIQPTNGLAKRLFLIGLALGLMMAILPPYPHLLNGYQSSEFRWRFALGVSGLLLVLSLPAVSWLFGTDRSKSLRMAGGLLLALALVGAVPALWQFSQVRGAIEAVYGTRLGWGWGMAVFLIGWMMVGVIGGRLLLPRNHA